MCIVSKGFAHTKNIQSPVTANKMPQEHYANPRDLFWDEVAVNLENLKWAIVEKCFWYHCGDNMTDSDRPGVSGRAV